jgi:putative MFS transporter
MALQAWYSEFLPTKGRGALLAMYTIGWPFGRAVAIMGSRAGLTWRALSLLSAMLLTCFGFVLTSTTESPRFLASIGRVHEARSVVERMYTANGRRFEESFGAAEPGPSVGGSGTRGRGGLAGLARRLQLLRTSYGRLTAYASMLFAVLSTTTVLIDTWGPSVYSRLLFPDEDGLPHRVLFLFNVADLCGILLSVAVVDLIGRKGSFVVGFGGQAAFFLLVALASVGLSTWPVTRTYTMVALGSLTAATRCFGWEAAHMWTVEVFPTAVRATAVAVTQALMRLVAVGTVTLSATAASDAPPVQCLLFVAMMLSVGLVVTYSLPRETANAPMGEHV